MVFLISWNNPSYGRFIMSSREIITSLGIVLREGMRAIIYRRYSLIVRYSFLSSLSLFRFRENGRGTTGGSCVCTLLMVL